jgi:ATP-binding cassette, subfamily B, bacterial
MRLLFRYLRPDWRAIALALIFAAVGQVSGMLEPLIVRYVIDTFALRVDQYSAAEFLGGVGLLLLGTVAANLAARATKSVQEYYVNVVKQRLGTRLYGEGIRHTLQLPYSALEDHRSGETLAVLHKARTDAERLVMVSINLLFMAIVGLVFVIVYASTIHWIIAPIYVVAVVALWAISAATSRRITTMQKTIVAETAALAGSSIESLRNVELVKSLGLADQEITRLNNTNARVTALELAKLRHLKSLGVVQGAAVSLARAIITLVMLYLLYVELLTVGQFFSLFVYAIVIFMPIQELGNVVNIYRETAASLHAYQTMLRRPTEGKPIHPVPLHDLPTLRFDAVSFSHRSARAPALNGVSFAVRRGETIAFVGPSGAGKTTLVKLLLGLYRPDAGHIFYDGIASSDLDPDAVREHVGLVTQDTQLFAGTIRDNLRFVRQTASDAECLQVLQLAGCESFMSRAVHGLDTAVGEAGVKLSGGEKQRLSIARALLRRPRVLVFDEATSSLDSLTEAGVVNTIRAITTTGGTIVVLIAHRLSTVIHADRIYVMECGRIVETGRHDDLVTQQGLYHAMWRQQIGERRAARWPHASAAKSSTSNE